MESQTLRPPVSAITARLLKMLLRAIGHEGGEPACGQLPPGAIHLENIKLVLAGTRCDAPLYEEEIRDAAATTGSDVVLVRHGRFPETLNEVHFDVAIRMDLGIHLLTDLLLYCRPGDGYWLVPQGRGPFVALARDGLRLSFEPPFLTAHYREDGLVAAARQIVHAARNGSI